jgi:DNA-binding NarL/FixJ family response regulator
MLRILIADDYADTRTGLKTVLEMSPKLKVCGEASSGAQAVEMAKTLKPDAIVLDLRMPGGSGVDAAGKINAVMPDVPIVLISMYGALLQQGMVNAGVRKMFAKNEISSLRSWLESLERGGEPERSSSGGTEPVQSSPAKGFTSGYYV